MSDSVGGLEGRIEAVHSLARLNGLDFPPVRFEICPADVIYTLGAYGMPTRFGHWSFGKAYQKLKTQYEYNLIHIYELVINSVPCYAFLLEGNSLVQNQLVAAHVFGHADFFRHNCRLAAASSLMVESMAASAERIRSYEFRYGARRVEAFLDDVMSLQEQIDPWPPRGGALLPQKDLLLFLAQNARDLDDWQRDIITSLREEMLYFWPQFETRIMNEGWATFWHTRLMRQADLVPRDALEFARLHAKVTQPVRTALNPYLVGLRIFEDLERRYGLEKVFEAREVETDLSFIRNYLTRELVAELDLYLYRRMEGRWQVAERDPGKVRDTLVESLVNAGHPYIVVQDGDYQRTGGLYLRHVYEGRPLDLRHLEKTLQHLYRIWGRPVYLETVVAGKTEIFSFDGQRNNRTPAESGPRGASPAAPPGAS